MTARVVRIGSPQALVASLPALVLAGLAFRLAAPLPAWSLVLQCLFLAGTVLALVAFLTLGDCFAVLPSLRGIVSNGPYRLVRHPAYTGEFLMILACVLSSPSIWSATVLVAALPLVALRIRAEEQLLGETEDYRRYVAHVPFRLVPGVW